MMKRLALLLLLSIFLVSATALNKSKEDKQLEQCKETCEKLRLPHQLLRACKDRCEDEARDRSRSGDRGDNPSTGGESQGSQQQEDENPYVFRDEHFRTMRGQHGQLKVLQKFSDRSRFLRGLISAFRFAYLEVNPHVMMLPNHLDAELVMVVVQGRGRITLIHPQGRKNVNLRPGDVFRVPAGITFYLINRDNNEKLRIAKLVQPISIPGEFEPFAAAGANNYLSTFSPELLEAAFSTKRDRLRKWLEQQDEEFLVKASEEQIRDLTRDDQESGKGFWPFSKESQDKANIFEKRPAHSNRYGELREINPEDFRQLEDINIGISFANVSQGGMSTVYFNSESIKVAVVTNGKGFAQMACPHLSSSSSEESKQGRGGGSQEHGGRGGSQEQHSQSYQQVNANLNRGVVLIAPPGHPVIMAASQDENLEVLCFEINARNNQRTPLAGKNSIWNQMEDAAKELAFKMPSQQVDEILRSQNNEWFVKGPSQFPQQHEGRAYE